MRFLKLLKNGLDAILQISILFMLAGLVVTVTWQVLSRYVLSRPSTSTDELARFLMVWLVLLGAAYCVGKRNHLSIDLLPANASERLKKWSRVYVDTLILGFSLFVMVYGGVRLFKSMSDSQGISPALQMPLEYLFVILPIAGGLMAIYAAISIVENFMGTTDYESNTTPLGDN